MANVAASLPPGRRADKHRSIGDAARTVFGRDGYARTSIDAIAAAAGVSTRTIYNHFESKAGLFAAVLEASATEVADRFAADVEAIGPGPDLRADLMTLGRAFAAQRTNVPEHFAMVQQVWPEAAHFPKATIEAWQEAGPRRVQREMATRLEALARDGQLRIDDPVRTALHFIALTTAEVTLRAAGTPAPTGRALDEAVARGVDAFLNGYDSGAAAQA